MDEQQVAALVQALKRKSHVVVLTGAGASTEAGLPDWRGPEGIWKQWSATRLASLSAMRRHPVEFYQFYRYRLAKLRGASPGPVQRALAALERAGYVHTIITQNIDGLHQAAGSKDVIEVHGNLDHAVCVDCGARYDASVLDVDVETEADLPRCTACRGLLKPSIVLFEEPLPHGALERAFAAASRAGLFMVVGSSLEVGPVNQLPVEAVRSGAELAIINMSPTHLDYLAKYLIRERTGEVLLRVAAALGVEVAGAESVRREGA